ncbi:MAG: NADAR family protein [Bacteroidaceae bacterium]|nr:NADAR family protein [Bacteroidaceae bacterium]
MRYNVEKIKEIVRKNPTTEIIYFWGHTPNHKKITKSCFSQWYDVYFVVDGLSYHTTEQYMMASKARLFGDEETLKEIMGAESPREYKKLGRKVKGFDAIIWNEKRLDIVVEGNKAKFSQNPALKEFLLATGDAILAEASPYDKIWGIGMDEKTAAAGRVEDWRGENLLGCALMEVRDWIKNNDL